MTEPYLFWYDYINSMKPVQTDSESDVFIHSFLTCLSHEIQKSSDPELRMIKKIAQASVPNSVDVTQECFAYFTSLGLFGSHTVPKFGIASRVYAYLVVVLKQHGIIRHPILDTYIHLLYGKNDYIASQSIFTYLCINSTPSESSSTDIQNNYIELIQSTANLLLVVMRVDVSTDTNRFKYLANFYSIFRTWLANLFFCANHQSPDYNVADIIRQDLLIELFPGTSFATSENDVYDDFSPVFSSTSLDAAQRDKVRQNHYSSSRSTLALQLQQPGASIDIVESLRKDLRTRYDEQKARDDANLKDLGAMARLLDVFPVYVPVSVNFLDSLNRIQSHDLFRSCYSVYVQ